MMLGVAVVESAQLEMALIKVRDGSGRLRPC